MCDHPVATIVDRANRAVAHEQCMIDGAVNWCVRHESAWLTSHQSCAHAPVDLIDIIEQLVEALETEVE